MASDTLSSATGTPGSASPTGNTPGVGATSAGATGGTTKGDRAELEAQIAKLREDVSGVTESLKKLATNRASGAREQAYAMRDDVSARGERYLRQAQDAANDLERQMTDQIREEPIKSVLIAAAVGYLYARIFR